jgi:hypothetical protein
MQKGIDTFKQIMLFKFVTDTVLWEQLRALLSFSVASDEKARQLDKRINLVYTSQCTMG